MYILGFGGVARVDKHKQNGQNYNSLLLFPKLVASCCNRTVWFCQLAVKHHNILACFVPSSHSLFLCQAPGFSSLFGDNFEARSSFLRQEYDVYRFVQC